MDTIVRAVAAAAAIAVPGIASAQAIEAISGATLWDGSGAGVVENAVVLVQNGRLACVGDSAACPIPAATPTLDAGGRWIVPGLVDSHIHWQLWYDEDGELSPETAARAARVYLANGVTTVVDVGGQYWVGEEHRSVLGALSRSGEPAPAMIFSGWVDRRELDRSGVSARQRTRQLLESGIAGVKIRNGLTLEEIQAIVQEAHSAGVPVYGHTYDTTDESLVDYTAEAVALGVDGIFHVLGIPPVPSDSPLLTPDLDQDDWEGWWLAGADLWNHVTDSDMDRLILAMVRNGAWLQPTLVTEQATVIPGWWRDDPAWRYAPVPWEEMTLGWPEFDPQELAIYQGAYDRMKVFVRRFHEAGGMLVAGTDGLPLPGFGLHEEIRLLAEAGVPHQEALLAATRNAATAWGRAGQFGVLTAGATADLLILDGDPLADIGNTRRIWRVMSRGMLYEPAQLLSGAVPPR